ncbi:hypothetical protein Fot_06185 [Forsythia ovata]|uniref:Uncharacterized protein n=1 Tax=Forsythia ovata TaxID=205694 RepID=A0ABD1WS98_9LAMI
MATVPLVPKVAVGVSSHFHPRESLLLSENVRQRGKGKGIGSKLEKVGQKGADGDEDNAMDSRRIKRGRMTPPQETGRSTQSSQGATQTAIPAPYGWTEHNNIGSCQDELDLSVLENLPAHLVTVVASVSLLGEGSGQCRPIRDVENSIDEHRLEPYT